jgi:hypothetical protein
MFGRVFASQPVEANRSHSCEFVTRQPRGRIDMRFNLAWVYLIYLFARQPKIFLAIWGALIVVERSRNAKPLHWSSDVDDLSRADARPEELFGDDLCGPIHPFRMGPFPVVYQIRVGVGTNEQQEQVRRALE